MSHLLIPINGFFIIVQKVRRIRYSLPNNAFFPFEGKEFRGFVTNIDVSCYWCITCDCIVCLKVSF